MPEPATTAQTPFDRAKAILQDQRTSLRAEVAPRS